MIYCMIESSNRKTGDIGDYEFKAKDNIIQVLNLLKFFFDMEWSEVKHDQGIALNGGMTLETFLR